MTRVFRRYEKKMMNSRTKSNLKRARSSKIKDSSTTVLWMIILNMHIWRDSQKSERYLKIQRQRICQKQREPVEKRLGAVDQYSADNYLAGTEGRKIE